MDGRNPAPVENDSFSIYRVSTIQGGGAGFHNHPQYEDTD